MLSLDAIRFYRKKFQNRNSRKYKKKKRKRWIRLPVSSFPPGRPLKCFFSHWCICIIGIGTGISLPNFYTSFPQNEEPNSFFFLQLVQENTFLIQFCVLFSHFLQKTAYVTCAKKCGMTTPAIFSTWLRLVPQNSHSFSHPTLFYTSCIIYYLHIHV